MALEKSEQYTKRDSSRISRVEPRKCFSSLMLWKDSFLFRGGYYMETMELKELINTKQKGLIVVGRKSFSTGMGKIKFDLMAIIDSENKEESFGKYHNLSSIRINELMRLAEIDFYEYVSQLIEINFQGELINKCEYGTDLLLPIRINGGCSRYISFSNQNFSVYFIDNAINYFTDKIQELKSRRLKDNYTYSSEVIESGKISNLMLSFTDSSSWQRASYCLFRKNAYFLVHPEDSSNISDKKELPDVLQICLDTDYKYDQEEIISVLEIIDKFVSINGPIKKIYYANNSLVAVGGNEKECFIEIEGTDKTKQIVKKITSLYSGANRL